MKIVTGMEKACQVVLCPWWLQSQRQQKEEGWSLHTEGWEVNFVYFFSPCSWRRGGTPTYTPLGGDTGKLFALDIQRCGRKEVTNIQQWLLWLRWAAIAMEVEIHRETQKLLTASQYSLHNIHPDSREGLNWDLDTKNCSCQAHTTLTSLKCHITSLRHTVFFYCSFSWPRFQEWACAVQVSSPSPQRYAHWPAGHRQLWISVLLRIPARARGQLGQLFPDSVTSIQYILCSTINSNWWMNGKVMILKAKKTIPTLHRLQYYLFSPFSYPLSVDSCQF